MSPASEPVTVALLALPVTTAAVIYGFYDVLASVRRDWTWLHGGPVADSPFRPLVVSPDGQPFDTPNGVRITPQASFASCPRPDVAVVRRDGRARGGHGRPLRRRGRLAGRLPCRGRAARFRLLRRAGARAHRPARWRGGDQP